MVVLGRMGSIPGVILGAVVLSVLPEVFRGFESYRMLLFGGAAEITELENIMVGAHSRNHAGG